MDIKDKHFDRTGNMQKIVKNFIQRILQLIVCEFKLTLVSIHCTSLLPLCFVCIELGHFLFQLKGKQLHKLNIKSNILIGKEKTSYENRSVLSPGNSAHSIGHLLLSCNVEGKQISYQALVI